MSREIRCDRCGVIIRSENDVIRGLLNKPTDGHLSFFRISDREELNFDMCTECMAEFVAWMQGGPRDADRR